MLVFHAKMGMGAGRATEGRAAIVHPRGTAGVDQNNRSRSPSPPSWHGGGGGGTNATGRTDKGGRRTGGRTEDGQRADRAPVDVSSASHRGPELESPTGAARVQRRAQLVAE